MADFPAGLALVSRFAKISIPYVPPHFACEVYINYSGLCCTTVCLSGLCQKGDRTGSFFS